MTTPAETAEIIPPFVTVATEGLLLVHVPPVDGVIDELAPMHNSCGPVNDTGSPLLTVIVIELSDTQP